MTPLTTENIEDFLKSCSDETRIYLGCDSARYRIGEVWYADYCSVAVVHVDGCKGAKIFGRIDRERLYDTTPEKPSMRLLGEAQRIASLFQELEDTLTGYHVEIHLDLNPDEHFKSSQVLSQAVGWIRGICHIEPMVKPNAWAASTAADRFVKLRLAA